jgi:hypothetical protein
MWCVGDESLEIAAELGLAVRIISDWLGLDAFKVESIGVAVATVAEELVVVVLAVGTEVVSSTAVDDKSFRSRRDV